MKKKRSPVHEGIIICLRMVSLEGIHVQEMINLYAIRDSACPAEAIPHVIVALECRRTMSPDLEKMIERAIANLRTQLAEHEAEVALSSENNAKAEARAKEEEDFKNLKIPWSYVGKFFMELCANASKNGGIVLPFMSEKNRIYAAGSGIVLDLDEGEDQHWPWKDIETIWDGEGNLLWKRKRNKKSVKLPPPLQPNAADLSQRLGLDRSSNHP